MSATVLAEMLDKMRVRRETGTHELEANGWIASMCGILRHAVSRESDDARTVLSKKLWQPETCAKLLQLWHVSKVLLACTPADLRVCPFRSISMTTERCWVKSGRTCFDMEPNSWT